MLTTVQTGEVLVVREWSVRSFWLCPADDRYSNERCSYRVVGSFVDIF